VLGKNCDAYLRKVRIKNAVFRRVIARPHVYVTNRIQDSELQHVLAI